MRYPEFLRENVKIGFVAASFGCAIEPYRTAFKHALDKFKGLGYQVELGPNCFMDVGIGISNNPHSCGDESNHVYCRTTNDTAIHCGGRERTCDVN